MLLFISCYADPTKIYDTIGFDVESVASADSLPPPTPPPRDDDGFPVLGMNNILFVAPNLSIVGLW